MGAPDLRAGPPRRWNATVDGIVWLPRLADKARAFDAGTLGSYLYGQSPIDDAFLRRAGLDYHGFLEIVRDAPDDDGVLAGIERRNPGATEQLRIFSQRLPQKSALLLWVLEYDEGYVRPWWGGVARPVGNAAFALIVGTLRAARPMRREKSSG
jgi:uncharacterized protein DUF5069